MLGSEQRPARLLAPPVVALLVWLCWAAFGFLHGGHWLVIAFFVAQHPGERRRAIIHFACYITGILATALGGGYVRLEGKHRGCGNETGSMGRDCLWVTQSADYAFVYVLHYIGLGFCCVCWVYDAVQLPGWLGQARSNQPLHACYSAWPLTGWAYAALLGWALLWVSLTWAAFVDWKTNDNGLQTLAAFLLLAGVLSGLAGCGVMHAIRPRATAAADGPVVKPSSTSSATGP